MISLKTILKNPNYLLNLFCLPTVVSQVNKLKFDTFRKLFSVIISTVFLLGSNALPAMASALDDGKYNCNSGELELDQDVTIGYFTITTDAVTGDNICTGAVIIPNGVRSIGNRAFLSQTQLTSVTIPNSVTSIGDYAFYENYKLTSVTIPDSVITIGDYAFYSNIRLISVTIGNSVTSIGINAFENTSLTSVIIPNSVTTIGVAAFYRNVLLTSVSFGNSVTSIGDSAFEDTSLTSLVIPNSVLTIGEGSFYSVPLTEITLGNHVATIKGYAFFGTRINSITIPASITSIYEYSFNEATSLKSVIFLGNAPTIMDYDGAPFEVFSNIAIGAKAYVGGIASGFGAVGADWNGLVVSYDTPPADDDDPPPSGGGSDSSTSTPSVSTSSVATKSVDASFKLTNRKYLSKFEIRKAITKGRSFKRNPIDIYKYSISKTSEKNCVMSGNYVMRLKENAVCEITVTRTTTKDVMSKYQVKINYSN